MLWVYLKDTINGRAGNVAVALNGTANDVSLLVCQFCGLTMWREVNLLAEFTLFYVLPLHVELVTQLLFEVGHDFTAFNVLNRNF